MTVEKGGWQGGTSGHLFMRNRLDSACFLELMQGKGIQTCDHRRMEMHGALHRLLIHKSV